eukprot:TRINITY_DN5308_c0_g1_i3.p1 TRINITY_DN5308_c0_g1~~TRINITY_DN5308_c0_g1_i3.p1  ORF type:complete len:613 (-),score=132.55 TRINITY_DN5308_c0_g1_i3:518-2356(-)
MSRDDVLDSTALKIDTGVTTRSSPLDAKDFLQNALQDSCSGHGHEESDKNPIEFEKSEDHHIAGENTNVEETHDGNSSEQVSVSESAVSSRPSDHLEASLQDESDSCKSCSDLGNWRAVWDDFYMRNYFYNIRTYESTWYPPPGMEYFAFSDSAAESGEMIAGDAENNAGPELAGNDNKVLDVCGSQDYTYIFQEAQNDDKLSSHPSQTVTSSMDHAALNSAACLIPSTTCSTRMDLDEPEGNVNCFGIKRNSDGDLYPVHSNSLSDTQEPVDRLPNMVNQLGFGEVLTSELQPKVVKSKTDELIAFNHFDRPEMDATSVEAMKLFDDSSLQVSDIKRSVTEVCYEETEESDMPLTEMSSAMDEMGEYHEFSYAKKKKKLKTRSRRKKLSTDKQECPLQGMSEGFTVGIVKYWWQRYLLFSRFDDGIKMDEEGWFSVTPEPIARHQASRCGSGTVIDCFTGVGGNAIQFAKRCKHVIAIDIDPQKINYAQHNATIYGVNENIDFIKGDFFRLAPKLKGDTIFMSPPWGGPDYAKVQTYDISTMLKPHDGHLLFEIASRIASSIVMFLPRNVDLNQLAEISLSANPPWSLEVEKNFLNGKLKAITAYFKDVSL